MLETDTQASSETPAEPESRNWSWLIVGLVVVVLMVAAGAIGWWVGSSDGDEATGFPTGTFVSTTTDDGVEFRDDGTGRAFGPGWEVPLTYAVNGDLWTEMTFEWPTGVQAPATYYWSFDGETLSFELWGEDVRPGRNGVYSQSFVRRDW